MEIGDRERPFGEHSVIGIEVRDQRPASVHHRESGSFAFARPMLSSCSTEQHPFKPCLPLVLIHNLEVHHLLLHIAGTNSAQSALRACSLQMSNTDRLYPVSAYGPGVANRLVYLVESDRSDRMYSLGIRETG